jgi:hypothetical protein
MKEFPVTIKPTINLIVSNDIEYSEMLPAFRYGATELAKKYNLSCSFVER